MRWRAPGSQPSYGTPAPTVPLAVPVRTSGGLKRVVPWLGWVAAGLAGALAVWAMMRPRPEIFPSRLAIMAPGLGGSGAGSSQRHLAFLPDGHGLVYAVTGSDGIMRLVRQSLDAEAPSPIPGAVNLGSPIVSPDGRSLVATQAGKNQMLRLPLEGGTPELLVRQSVMLTESNDAVWARDGSVWLTKAGAVAQVVGDSVVRRGRGNQYQLTADPAGRAHRGGRAGPARQHRRAGAAGGPRDRRRDTAAGHAGHRRPDRPGLAGLRPAERKPPGRSLRPGAPAG